MHDLALSSLGLWSADSSVRSQKSSSAAPFACRQFAVQISSVHGITRGNCKLYPKLAHHHVSVSYIIATHLGIVRHCANLMCLQLVGSHETLGHSKCPTTGSGAAMDARRPRLAARWRALARERDGDAVAVAIAQALRGFALGAPCLLSR